MATTNLTTTNIDLHQFLKTQLSSHRLPYRHKNQFNQQTPDTTTHHNTRIKAIIHAMVEDAWAGKNTQLFLFLFFWEQISFWFGSTVKQVMIQKWLGIMFVNPILVKKILKAN